MEGSEVWVRQRKGDGEGGKLVGKWGEFIHSYHFKVEGAKIRAWCGSFVSYYAEIQLESPLEPPKGERKTERKEGIF